MSLTLPEVPDNKVLPQGVGLGGYIQYSEAAPAYDRAASLRLGLESRGVASDRPGWGELAHVSVRLSDSTSERRCHSARRPGVGVFEKKLCAKLRVASSPLRPRPNTLHPARGLVAQRSIR